jgi:rSAM/selenodomain-associated transferase 1
MFATVPPPIRRLLVFARLPELGKVKTRLAESIGAEKALAVYAAMLRDVLESIGRSSEEIDVEIVWAPTAAASGEALRRAFDDRPLAMQTGATLGDRLAMAFSERFLFQQTEKIVAIGVDDPLMNRATIEEAFALLESCEWVIGPARDGGYYLIGCRAATFNVAIFQDVPFGSDSVLPITLERMREWKHSVATLPLRYDIDVIDDLRQFAAENRDRRGELPRLLREWGMAA